VARKRLELIRPIKNIISWLTILARRLVLKARAPGSRTGELCGWLLLCAQHSFVSGYKYGLRSNNIIQDLSKNVPEETKALLGDKLSVAYGVLKYPPTRNEIAVC
jgi:hypothetical protein